MEAPWVPTVLSMLGDIPHGCLIVKDLVMDISVDQVLKVLELLYLTLWQLRDVCWARILCHGLSVSGGVTQVSTTKVYQQSWERIG